MVLAELTEGDTAPVTFKQFRDADGAAVITNTITSVQFSLKNQSGGATPVSLVACVVTSAATEGLVCQWLPGVSDLNVAGTYDAELVVTFTSGKVKRFPAAAGGFVVVVRAKVA